MGGDCAGESVTASSRAGSAKLPKRRAASNARRALARKAVWTRWCDGHELPFSFLTSLFFRKLDLWGKGRGEV